MVDKSLLLRKLAELETYRGQIKEFSDITLSGYRKDWKAQRIIERTLQIMIETCSDIADHIISDAAMRSPTSYADTFRVLFENRIITRNQLFIMEKMAKFRNVVVNQYEAVDAEIIINILRKHLKDFEEFKKAVLEYLKK